MQKSRIVLLFIVALLLVSAFCSPCQAMDVGSLDFHSLSEFEEYWARDNVYLPANFVYFDMVSILGDFYVVEFYRDASYRYTFAGVDGAIDMRLKIHNELLPYEVSGSNLGYITEGMLDMRQLEQNDRRNLRIRHCGLEYTYYNGVLSYIIWQHGGLYFKFVFDNETQMDMNHPIIGKLLSRDKKDVKEGLKLLKAHMYKNGFNNEPLIIWSTVALVVVAGLAVFLILRARLAKHKALSPTSTIPDAPNPDVQP